jgi:hypothetical protein
LGRGGSSAGQLKLERSPRWTLRRKNCRHRGTEVRWRKRREKGGNGDDIDDGQLPLHSLHSGFSPAHRRDRKCVLHYVSIHCERERVDICFSFLPLLRRLRNVNALLRPSEAELVLPDTALNARKLREELESTRTCVLAVADNNLLLLSRGVLVRDGTDGGDGLRAWGGSQWGVSKKEEGVDAQQRFRKRKSPRIHRR